MRPELNGWRRVVTVAVVLVAVAAAIALVVAAASVQECPLNATQAQIDATGCIVGANIGLGLAVLVGVPIIFCVAGLALWALGRPRGAAPPEPM